MTDREVMQMALQALESRFNATNIVWGLNDKTITALKAALERPEQEQHQPWCNSVTKLLLSNPPQIPPCNCKQEPVTQSEQEPVALIRDGELRWHLPHEHYARPGWTAHGTHMLYAHPPQQQAEPVAWQYKTVEAGEFVSEHRPVDVGVWQEIEWSKPLYAQPPQRQPLTDEDIEQAQRTVWRSLPSDFDYTTSSWIEIGIRYAEAAHGIGEKS